MCTLVSCRAKFPMRVPIEPLLAPMFSPCTLPTCAPACHCVCLSLVGVQSSSNIYLSVQVNLYLLGECVCVCMDVCVCVCGCVCVCVCVQKRNKETRRSIARTTHVDGTPRPALLFQRGHFRAGTSQTLRLATPPRTALYPFLQVLIISY